MITDTENTTHVAVGVIYNEQGRILISHRPEHVHQGNLWEFPGGKVEQGEEVSVALARELHEELGIDVKRSEFLIQIPHQYPDKHVLLDVYKVTSFSGEAHGREDQQIKWVDVDELVEFDFPEANRSILTAIQLASDYAITGAFEDTDEALKKIRHMLDNGIRLVQLRAKQLDEAQYLELAEKALSLCESYHARLILNAEPELLDAIAAHGIQLSSDRLRRLESRPVADNVLLGASVHNEQELARALQLNADFVLVSPVKPTRSHPDMAALGWERFEQFVDACPVPVFALGGVSASDRAMARQRGGHGIAAIRSFWDQQQ